MDKSPPGKSSLSLQAKIVSALCEDLDYTDVWRAQHVAEKEKFFFSNVNKSFTKIDYFFLPRIMLQSVIYSFIGNIVISDHAAVSIQYNLRNPADQTRHWKFNPSILTDHKFISYFREEFQSFLSVNSASTNVLSLLWKTSKAF